MLRRQVAEAEVVLLERILGDAEQQATNTAAVHCVHTHLEPLHRGEDNRRYDPREEPAEAQL